MKKKIKCIIDIFYEKEEDKEEKIEGKVERREEKGKIPLHSPIPSLPPHPLFIHLEALTVKFSGRMKTLTQTLKTMKPIGTLVLDIFASKTEKKLIFSLYLLALEKDFLCEINLLELIIWTQLSLSF